MIPGTIVHVEVTTRAGGATCRAGMVVASTAMGLTLRLFRPTASGRNQDREVVLGTASRQPWHEVGRCPLTWPRP